MNAIEQTFASIVGAAKFDFCTEADVRLRDEAVVDVPAAEHVELVAVRRGRVAVARPGRVVAARPLVRRVVVEQDLVRDRGAKRPDVVWVCHDDLVLVAAADDDEMPAASTPTSPNADNWNRSRPT